MLFNSFTFLALFFPIVALGNAGLRQFCNARYAQWWLLLASLFFYAFATASHILLLLGSIGFNWAIAKRIGTHNETGPRRRWLWLGIIANIAFLSTFKYVNFFLGQFDALLGIHLAIPNWAFPLGISFFTLTQVMYLIDCYERMTEPISLLDHASAVSFFPYVSSGPIIRSAEIASQFVRDLAREERWQLACRGLHLFALGLAKKVVFADTFAHIADAGFGAVGNLSTIEAWSFSLAYTLQIYYDFSGYSEMAVGTAWMLGFNIPQNFNSPYISKSISEFWQRWHMSLSNFITNYLYTPILRSMGRATLRTSAISIILAMGIAGLWHGPAWTFIVFGVLHGIALAVNQIWRKSKRKLPRGVAWVLTFAFVNVAFVFFRSPDLATAMQFVAAMIPRGNVFGTSILMSVIPFSPLTLVRPVAIGLVLAFFFKSAWERAMTLSINVVSSLGTALLLAISIFYLNSSVAKRFVYFAF